MTEKKTSSLQSAIVAIFELLLTVVVPVLILSKGESHFGISPLDAFTLAVAVPLVWTVSYFFWRQEVSFWGVLSVVITFATEVSYLFEAPPVFFALKQAVPGVVLGTLCLASVGTRHNVGSKVLLNEDFYDVARIRKSALDRGNSIKLEKHLSATTRVLAGLMFSLAASRAWLAYSVVNGVPGSSSYNQSVAEFIVLAQLYVNVSFTVALFLVAFWSIRRLTHISGIPFRETVRS